MLPAKVYFVQLEGIFFNPNFHHEKIKIFKKKFQIQKSSLADKLESATSARNSKKHKLY